MTQTMSGERSSSATPMPKALNPRWRALRRELRRPAVFASTAYVVLLVLVAVLGPVLISTDPSAQDLDARFAPPSAAHWLGQDDYGRDVLARLVHASRISLLAPLIAVGVAVLIGVPAALLAAYRRGFFDSTSNLVSDTFLSIPAIVFALTIITLFGRGLVTSMVAIGIVFSPYLFRVTRGAAMVASKETFVRAAESSGANAVWIMRRHLLPNVLGPVVVQVTILLGLSLLAEASLSFLGLGVQAPDASWGSMLKSAYDSQFDSPFGVLPAGIALVITVLAFNTLGDALRDALVGRGRTGDSDDE